MKLPRGSVIDNHSPEYRHALQELIKFEMQALVERLSATGEEALVLTASCHDGASIQFGSQKAEGFLRKQINLGQDFVQFCNDESIQSSADELCNSGDEMEEDQKSEKVDLSKQPPTQVQFSPHRQLERTTSKRISFTEDHPKDSYEVSQNSDLSASERNDSASSVASFSDAQKSNKLAKKSLQCKICSRNFRSYKTLNAHSRLHMAKSYKCAVCGKIFTLKKSYQRHISSHKLHHLDKLFECGICDKSFADLNAWKRHREIHLEVRNYSCNLCGKAFVEKYSLRVHQTSHFYSSVKTDKHADITSGYPCHICGKLSKTKTAMNKHMLTHSAKKFTCEFCNKRFSVKYSYIRHRRIHTGEKPYKCGFCERSFSDSSAWAKHIKTHSGGKEYSCQLCSKSFYDKTMCKTHMKRHQVGKHSQSTDRSENRNFEIVKSEVESKFDDETGSKEQIDYGNSDTNIYDEDLSLRIDVSDKESEDSRLLDSGFGQKLLPVKDNNGGHDRSPEKKFTSLIDSIGLDEKFQTEFVERHMPSKPLESDNEFISTSFPDDSELLAVETETEVIELEDGISSNYETESPLKKKVKERSHLDNVSSGRKTSHSKSTYSKYTSESWIKCKKCNKRFGTESLLKNHLQFHCMMKLYKCRYCSKQLTTKQSLIRHERIHIGDRPYQCYVCQKTFADKHGCIRHVNTHFAKENKASSGMMKNKIVPKTSEPSHVNEIVKQRTSYTSTMTECLPSKPHASCSSMVEHTVTVSDVEKLKGAKMDDKIITKEATVSKCLDNVKHEVTIQEGKDKQQFFKCYRCPALFPSEKLCIEHVQACVSSSPENVFGNKSPKQAVEQKLNNIYQCMLCLKMFSDREYCQKHINTECQKNAAVSSYCDMSSFLSDTDLNSSTQVEYLPELPFQEVITEPSYLDTEDNEIPLFSDDISPSSSNLPSPSYVPLTGVSTCGTQSSMNVVQSTQPVTQSTSILTPSSVAQSQSSLTLSQPKSSVSEKLSNKPQQQGTLLLIPFGQVPGQSSATLCLQSASQSGNNITSGEPSYSGLQQKPVVNIGSNKYLLTSHSIGLVGAQGVTSSTNQKGGKQKRPKSPESDLKERTCTICSKVFTTKHILKQHTLIHMERNFGCKFCMKKFHNKYGRDRHERIHTGEKPFSCPTCKKAFSDNSTYRKHTWKCCSGKTN